MSDTFSVSSGTVELVINGNSRGQVPTGGQSVGAFVTAQAKNHGLKSFSVYINGTKFFTEQANSPLTEGSKVEIVAKDARGLMVLTGSEGPTPAVVMQESTPPPVQEPKKEDGDPGDEMPRT